MKKIVFVFSLLISSESMANIYSLALINNTSVNFDFQFQTTANGCNALYPQTWITVGAHSEENVQITPVGLRTGPCFFQLNGYLDSPYNRGVFILTNGIVTMPWKFSDAVCEKISNTSQYYCYRWVHKFYSPYSYATRIGGGQIALDAGTKK